MNFMQQDSSTTEFVLNHIIACIRMALNGTQKTFSSLFNQPSTFFFYSITKPLGQNKVMALSIEAINWNKLQAFYFLSLLDVIFY